MGGIQAQFLAIISVSYLRQGVSNNIGMMMTNCEPKGEHCQPIRAKELYENLYIVPRFHMISSISSLIWTRKSTHEHLQDNYSTPPEHTKRAIPLDYERNPGL